MAKHSPDPSPIPDRRLAHSPLLLAGVAAAAFIALLVVIITLTNRLENRADSLRYSGPVPGPQTTLAIDIAQAQTVYVPIYSHIYSKGGEPFLLEATLSIRNSDPERTITIGSADYYNTQGERVQQYLPKPLTLQPLESTAVLVEKTDTRGGSGANFIIKWHSEQPVYEPVIEAIMIGIGSGHSISFKSTGRPLAERAETSTGSAEEASP